MIKYSIIIPIYNASKYLEKCISSILLQSYKNFELLLINDGSTDNSLFICDKYKNRDERVIVLNKENGGVSSARNLGLKHASGDYVTFIDADDFVDLQFLEEINSILNENNVDILKYSYTTIYGSFQKKYHFTSTVDKVILYDSYKEEIFNNLFCTYDFTNIWNCFFKKELIHNLKFDINLKYAEDRKFMFDALLMSKSLFISSKRFYNYIINPSSAMNSKNLEKNFLQLSNNLFVKKYMLLCLDDNLYINSFLNSICCDIDNFIIENYSLKNFKNFKQVVDELFHIDLFIELKQYIKKELKFKIFENYISKKKYYKLLIKKIIIKIKKIIKKILM